MWLLTLLSLASSAGMSYVTVHGSVFEPARKLVGKPFTCPMCMGFWTGLLHAMLLYGYSDPVAYTIPFAASAASVIFDAGVGLIHAYTGSLVGFDSDAADG